MNDADRDLERRVLAGGGPTPIPRAEDDEQMYYRWLDEMEDRIFGPQSRDPRRARPADRDAAPAHANARIDPQ